jgi:hypothetical protein
VRSPSNRVSSWLATLAGPRGRLAEELNTLYPHRSLFEAGWITFALPILTLQRQSGDKGALGRSLASSTIQDIEEIANVLSVFRGRRRENIGSRFHVGVSPNYAPTRDGDEALRQMSHTKPCNRYSQPRLLRLNQLLARGCVTELKCARTFGSGPQSPWFKSNRCNRV